MTEKKLDRRIRKTRALLLNGLIELLKKKDIKDISVKELTNLADLNRGTFYLHYNDIHDMIHKIEDELFVEFEGILDRNIDKNDGFCSPEKTILDIFTFLENNRDFAKVMMGEHGDLAFVNRLKSLVENRLQSCLLHYDDGEKYSYYPPFIISGFIGIIETWLYSPNPESAQEMSGICAGILKTSIFPAD